MEPLYAVDSFNYPDGYPLALLAATVGMFLGVICGAVLVNLAPLAGKAPDASGGGGGTGSVPYSTSQRLRLRLRKMGAAVAALKATAPESDHYGPRERPAAATQTVSAESLDSLMFHVCLVLCVMCVGYVLRLPVVAIEEVFPKGSFLQKSNLLSVLPLFLFCLLGGLAVQKCVDRTRSTFIDRETIVRISNTAQDVLIVAAISRLGRNGLPPGVHGLGNFFRVVFESGAPFILVCVGGIAWGVASFWYIAPRMLPDHWAERGLVEFGVSIGATSTGLLLLRMADPDGKTPVLRDFTFKQIFHVLITGGGFFDVLIPIPLCAASGSAWPLCFVALAMISVCLLAHPGVGRRARRCLRNRGQKPMVKAGGMAAADAAGGGGGSDRASAAEANGRPRSSSRDGAAAMELQITTEIAVPPEGAGV